MARAGEGARVDVEAAPAVVVADARAQLLDAVDVDVEVDDAVGGFARVVVVQAGVDDERVAERRLGVADGGGARVGGDEETAARAIVDLERASLDARAAAVPRAGGIAEARLIA